IQAHVLSVAPALRLLAAARTQAQSPAGPGISTRLLIVADPVYTSDDSRLHTGLSLSAVSVPLIGRTWLRSGTDLDALARLPSTAVEAAQIKKLSDSRDVDI